jgi:chromosome segregation ATPase
LSRPKGDAGARLVALEADVQRLTTERAHDADQIGEMLVRIAAAERARASAESRAAAAEQQAAAMRAEVAHLEARCAQLEADAWEVSESTRRVSVPQADVVRDALARLSGIVDELDRREEMAAGLRARTIEQLRQTLAEVDAPPSPPVLPTPVIEIKTMRPAMAEPDPFPTE